MAAVRADAPGPEPYESGKQPGTAGERSLVRQPNSALRSIITFILAGNEADSSAIPCCVSLARPIGAGPLKNDFQQGSPLTWLMDGADQAC